MFGKFFDTSAIDAFVQSVVDDLTKLIPPAQMDGASKQVRKRREQADERIRRQAATLATTTPLNVYQKAKLGVRLQEALEAAGYADDFSKPFAYEVVSMVATAASQKR